MKAAERFYFHQATAHSWYTKVNRRSGPQTGLWEVKDGVLGGLSATLPLRDYGRVARQPTTIAHRTLPNHR
jgi:hypothetical protein